jgi:hypothetical protein
LQGRKLGRSTSHMTPERYIKGIWHLNYPT